MLDIIITFEVNGKQIIKYTFDTAANFQKMLKTVGTTQIIHGNPVKIINVVPRYERIEAKQFNNSQPLELLKQQIFIQSL